MHSNSLARRTPSSRRSAVVQIAVDPEIEPISNPHDDHSVLEDFDPVLPTDRDKVSEGIDKENAGPERPDETDASKATGKVKRKPKKRKSIGQQSGRKKKRLSNESVRITEETPIGADEVSVDLTPNHEWETMIEEDSTILPVEMDAAVEQPDTNRRKRKKRKSVLLPSKRRRQSGEVAIEQAVSVTPKALANKSNRSQTEEVQSTSSIDRTPGQEPTQRRRRRLSSASAVQTPLKDRAYDSEEGEDDEYVDEDVSPEKPTPNVRSKKAQRNAKSRNSRSDVQEVTTRPPDGFSCIDKPSKSTFPILTHRLTNISALPTITEEVETESDEPQASASVGMKFPTRSTPNAIDVLSQICRETIETTLSKLAAGGNTSGKEVKRKRNAIEAFGQELDSRLFDMSAAVEHRLTLEARVKRARKEKLDLQARWIDVRRQREEIALKCDDIRARHKANEAQGRETYELSEKLHELDMVVDRGEVDGDGLEDLEFMLKSVAGQVSGAVGVGGMLDRVKEFNSQLQRTALVLEGRSLV